MGGMKTDHPKRQKILLGLVLNISAVHRALGLKYLSVSFRFGFILQISSSDLTIGGQPSYPRADWRVLNSCLCHTT